MRLLRLPDVVQALAANAAGEMGMKLSRGISSDANGSLSFLGALTRKPGGWSSRTSIFGSRMAKSTSTSAGAPADMPDDGGTAVLVASGEVSRSSSRMDRPLAAGVGGEATWGTAADAGQMALLTNEGGTGPERGGDCRTRLLHQVLAGRRGRPRLAGVPRHVKCANNRLQLKHASPRRSSLVTHHSASTLSAIQARSATCLYCNRSASSQTAGNEATPFDLQRSLRLGQA